MATLGGHWSPLGEVVAVDREALKAKANLLVIRRWQKRHEPFAKVTTVGRGESAKPTNTSILSRVPRRIAHALESERTNRFLSFLLRAAASNTADTGLSLLPPASVACSGSTDRKSPQRSNPISLDPATSLSPCASSRPPPVDGNLGSPPRDGGDPPTPPLVLDMTESIRPEDLVSLQAFVKTQPTLRGVYLRENDLDRVLYDALCGILKVNPTITHIGWRGHCKDGLGGADGEAKKAATRSLRGHSQSVANERHKMGCSEADYMYIYSSGGSDVGEVDEEEAQTFGDDTVVSGRVAATIARFRRQIAMEELYPNGQEQKALLSAFVRDSSKTPAVTSSSKSSQELKLLQRGNTSFDGVRRSSLLPPPHAHLGGGDGGGGGGGGKKRTFPLEERRLHKLLKKNRRYVKAKLKRDWVRDEVALYSRSVEALCEFVHQFFVAESFLRADLVEMEERQRNALIEKLCRAKREAQGIDRVQRLLKSIGDRLAWVAGRERGFRQLLCEEYWENGLVLCQAMESSRRKALDLTEKNTRSILRSIGNTSWALAVRAENNRREAHRFAKIACEENEGALREETERLCAAEMRRLRQLEQTERDAARLATTARVEKERKAAVMARRLEELNADREARDARDRAHHQQMLENAHLREREQLVRSEQTLRELFMLSCEDYFKAVQDLLGFEDALLEHQRAEKDHEAIPNSTVKQDEIRQYLGLLDVTVFTALRGKMFLPADAGSTAASGLENTTVGSEASLHEEPADTCLLTVTESAPRWVQLLNVIRDKVVASGDHPVARKPRIPSCASAGTQVHTVTFAESALIFVLEATNN